MLLMGRMHPFVKRTKHEVEVDLEHAPVRGNQRVIVVSILDAKKKGRNGAARCRRDEPGFPRVVIFRELRTYRHA